MRIPKSKWVKASKELHKAFKDYADIDTITKLNTHQMEGYLSMVRMLAAREKGWFITLPNEPEEAVDWSMKTFLHYHLHNNNKTDGRESRIIKTNIIDAVAMDIQMELRSRGRKEE